VHYLQKDQKCIIAFTSVKSKYWKLSQTEGRSKTINKTVLSSGEKSNAELGSKRPQIPAIGSRSTLGMYTTAPPPLKLGLYRISGSGSGSGQNIACHRIVQLDNLVI